uniref:Uncharacterized protein n=1 Tax=Oryza sativa subsp. japonica TaxID=39947 RepID=Q7Y142_ORYSJ|nr:hypothetical protein [Oryza sativa Japonica Group]
MQPDKPTAGPAPGVPVGSAPWSSGLCDCFDDYGLCCMTWWCPCITFGRVAEIVDRGSTSCGHSGALYVFLAVITGFQWMYLHLPRQDARPVRPLRRALRRLLHPLLVRAMRAHPGVQGARRARLRPQAWVAPQHGAPRRRRRRARRATHGTLASFESSIDHLSYSAGLVKNYVLSSFYVIRTILRSLRRYHKVPNFTLNFWYLLVFRYQEISNLR